MASGNFTPPAPMPKIPPGHVCRAGSAGVRAGGPGRGLGRWVGCDVPGALVRALVPSAGPMLRCSDRRAPSLAAAFHLSCHPSLLGPVLYVSKTRTCLPTWATDSHKYRLLPHTHTSTLPGSAHFFINFFEADWGEAMCWGKVRGGWRFGRANLQGAVSSVPRSLLGLDPAIPPQPATGSRAWPWPQTRVRTLLLATLARSPSHCLLAAFVHALC